MTLKQYLHKTKSFREKCLQLQRHLYQKCKNLHKFRNNHLYRRHMQLLIKEYTSYTNPSITKFILLTPQAKGTSVNMLLFLGCLTYKKKGK